MSRSVPEQRLIRARVAWRLSTECGKEGGPPHMAAFHAISPRTLSGSTDATRFPPRDRDPSRARPGRLMTTSVIPRRGVCLVLSAPSGAGKTAITAALRARDPGLRVSVSVTTRAPRPGEIDGVHYHFLTEAAFAWAERNGDLLEWARVLAGTHAYGTPRAPVEAALAAGEDMVFDIDWQGHRALRRALPGDAVGVFVLPPSLNALESRLRGRAGDDAAEIDRRMRLARDEISHWREFDHAIVNDRLDQAVEDVAAILRAARLATARRLDLRPMLAELMA